MTITLTRRTFLHATAAGLGASVAARASTLLAAESRPPRKFTMALACRMVGVRAEPREAIDLAHRYGFEAVEPSARWLGGLSHETLTQLLAEMKAKKLVWAAEGLPVDFRTTDKAFRDSIQRLPEFAKALQRAGATRVGTWISPSHSTLTYVENFRQHASRLREVAKILGDRGLRLGLEYVGPKTSWSKARFPFIHTMAKMKDLIAEIGRDNVGFMLDSWHWYTAHETADDILSLRAADVVCCHLNDAPKDILVDQQLDNRRDLPAATGVIDTAAFLRSLAKIGYDGPIAAELFRPDLGKLPREQTLELVAAAMKKAFALVDAEGGRS
jgi:sugar phosphate isomerase/epimerase